MQLTTIRLLVYGIHPHKTIEMITSMRHCMLLPVFIHCRSIFTIFGTVEVSQPAGPPDFQSSSTPQEEVSDHPPAMPLLGATCLACGHGRSSHHHDMPFQGRNTNKIKITASGRAVLVLHIRRGDRGTVYRGIKGSNALKLEVRAGHAWAPCSQR